MKREVDETHFMERCDDLVLMGFSGTGKTHFACALGKEACRRRMRTLYIRVPDLEEPRRAQAEKGAATPSW